MYAIVCKVRDRCCVFGAAFMLAWLVMAVVALSGTPASAQADDPAQLQVRIDRLESQLREMTGQVEQLSFQLRQMQDRLERFSQDTEFRFRDMSGGRVGGASSATVTPRAAPPPAAPQPQTPPSIASGGFFQPSPGTGSSQFGAPPQNLGTLPGPLNINPIAPAGPDESSAQYNAAPAGAGQQNPAQAALGVATDSQGEYDVAYAFILQRDYGGAELAFRKFLQANPDHRLAGNAQYWLGESFYARRQYREAADAFLNGYTRYRGSPKAPDSLFKLGLSLQALNQKDAACNSYAELDRKFPTAPRELKQRARTAMRDARC